MTAQGWFGFVSGAASLAGIVIYAVDTIRAKSEPERVSWLIWAAQYGVLVTAQWQQGARASLLPLAPQVVGTVFICAMSWRRGKGSVDGPSVVLMAISAAAMAAGWGARDAAAAVMLATLVELIGGARTALAVWRAPGTEPLLSWAALALSGLLDLGAVTPRGDPVMYIYPAGWVLMGVGIPLASWAGASKLRAGAAGG